jgi:transcriptional regulator with XRE-family HTH domain
MHKDAMGMTVTQARLSAAIKRSGMTEAQLAKIFDVSQSTISRLKNGKIAKVSTYLQKLTEFLGPSYSEGDGDFSELVALAKSSPALREALLALQRLMHENA